MSSEHLSVVWKITSKCWMIYMNRFHNKMIDSCRSKAETINKSII